MNKQNIPSAQVDPKKELPSKPQPGTQTPRPELGKRVRPLARSKRAWAVLAVCLLLVLTTGVVPVGKIPFLRQLAWAMGYDSQETENISFLKALLTWNEHSREARSAAEQEGLNAEDVGIFGRDGGYASARQRLERGNQSRLIDLRTVNAVLAKNGQKGDLLAGTHVQVDTGNGTKNPNVYLSGDEHAATQANSAALGEVYFGTDASAVARNTKDGFNSVNLLKRAANAPVSGGGPNGGTDWLMRMADRATRADAGLDGLADKLDSSGMLGSFGASSKVADTKARRDLYYAWLTGMASRRVPNVVLKKTLATAAFDGAEMPQKVFEMSGGTGIGLLKDDVTANMENVKIRLQHEKECEAVIKSNNIPDQVAEAQKNINGLAGSFPKTCEDVNGSFSAKLVALQNQCKQVKKGYSALVSKCGVAVKLGREGSCTTYRLQDRYDQYAAYCQSAKQKCARLTDPAQQKSCLAGIKSAASYDGGDCAGGGCSESGVNTVVRETFNVPVNGEDVDPSAGDFFPETDWGRFRLY